MVAEPAGHEQERGDRTRARLQAGVFRLEREEAKTTFGLGGTGFCPPYARKHFALLPKWRQIWWH
jgi:hypothetical protein